MRERDHSSHKSLWPKNIFIRIYLGNMNDLSLGHSCNVITSCKF